MIPYHRSRFACVSRLMGERKYLASSIFFVAPLRSAEGRRVLYDMIALCMQEAELAFRPGLEPDKCRCRMRSSD